MVFLNSEANIHRFFVNIGDQSEDFIVESLYFFSSSPQFIVLVKGQTTSRLSPVFTANITPSIPKELKVREK